MTENSNSFSIQEENTQLSETPLEEISPATEEVLAPKQPTIGELFKAKRLEKGLNLKTISQQTKILMGLLEHLENDELNKLPSKTYVRGFVKSAAKILGINQTEALNALEYTYDRHYRPSEQRVSAPEIQNEAARNTLSTIAATQIETVKNVTTGSLMIILKTSIALVIIAVVVYNLKGLLERTNEESVKLPQVLTTLHLRSKPAAKPAVAKTEEKAPGVTPATEEPIKVNLIQDKKELTQKTDITINDVNLKSVSIGEKQFTEDTNPPAENIEEIFPSRYKVAVTKGVENVYINATDGDSWITYKVDDKDIKKYVLRQGRTLFLRGEKIRLFIGNSKVIKVFYNNKLINFTGKSSIKNVVFPEELKTKFLNPLFVFQKDGTVMTGEDYVKAFKKDSPPGSTPGAPVGATPPTLPGATPSSSTPQAPAQNAVKKP